RFIATFNGDAAQTGFDQLEMIQFNGEKSAFEFYAIQFPIQRDSAGLAVRPGKNPDSCLICHGADPHPVWHSYSNWPGVYGANDDSVEGVELEALQSFLASRGTHPRYRYLAPHPGSAISPFAYEPRGNETFRPNFRMGLAINR